MAHREFRDERGRLWEVWDVIPGWADRRSLPERRDGARGESVERRDLSRRIGVRPELASGWLCFRAGEVKRRLAPIPNGWDELTDMALSELARVAALSTSQSRSV